ncbi:YciI family protein [Clostridium sp.]|uniref:YciI family protein n=1 Tax=Clostridium sp. TaxID=1506 RepID=UPI001A4AE348|nr:YciI family protein [Clostridium sp.]MBK5234390.1 hypothetical protein [Clostridium sp.]
MKKGEKLFVRIDYKNSNSNLTSENFEEHAQYLKAIASERYFLGGGFNNAKGGMVIFEAEDINEAKKITEKDPLIQKGFYRFELYEWELLILSDNK